MLVAPGIDSRVDAQVSVGGDLLQVTATKLRPVADLKTTRIFRVSAEQEMKQGSRGRSPVLSESSTCLSEFLPFFFGWLVFGVVNKSGL